MDDSEIQKLLDDAEIALNTSGNMDAYRLLKPLIIEGHPAALFLYAHFSVSDLESEEEFEKRHIEILKNLTTKGFLPAIYSLAVCYESGDLVEMDKVLAANLFKKAAEEGYPKAMVSHGLNMYYGSNGVPNNRDLGIKLIRDAASQGCDDAIEILRGLGYSEDHEPTPRRHSPL